MAVRGHGVVEDEGAAGGGVGWALLGETPRVEEVGGDDEGGFGEAAGFSDEPGEARRGAEVAEDARVFGRGFLPGGGAVDEVDGGAKWPGAESGDGFQVVLAVDDVGLERAGLWIGDEGDLEIREAVGDGVADGGGEDADLMAAGDEGFGDLGDEQLSAAQTLESVIGHQDFHGRKVSRRRVARGDTMKSQPGGKLQ